MKTLLAKLKRSSRAFVFRGKDVKPPNHGSDSHAVLAIATSAPGIGTTTANTARLQETEPQNATLRRQSLEGLEALPPEIRRYLLCALELDELKGIVHASPVFHQQYLLDRKYILHRSIIETLGDVSVDAYAAHICDPYTKETAEEALTVLESQLSIPNELKQPEFERMAMFYLRNIEPLMDCFCRPSLDLLEEDIKAGKIEIPDRALLQSPPRGIERLRLARAVYRYQILSSVSDRSWEKKERSDEDRDAQQKRVARFIELNHPWEIEQLLSFYDVILRPLENVYDDIEWEPPTYRFPDDGPFYAFGEEDHYLGALLEGSALRGIPLLRTLMLDIQEQKERTQKLHDYIVTTYVPFIDMDFLFSTTGQRDRRRNSPSHKDQMQASRDPLPFRGDGELEAPPLGWTILWHDTYSNLYGEHTEFYLRSWGYVFWSAKRLEQTGGKVLLERVCELNRPEDDARERLFDHL